ncbi:unnamed protein product [Sphagnum balticum]
MSPFAENEFVDLGDKIILSYEASIDGEKQESLSSQGELLTVGSNPLKEFDQSLLGMTVGETREFDILVPETGLPSYRGKTIHFSATVSMGSKIKKMPLDDTLAQKLGKTTFAELREFVVSTASSRVSDSERNAMHKQVIAHLVANHDFKVPEWLSASEAQYLASNSRKDWDSLSDEDKESFLEMASDNVKLSLIFDKIREVEPEAQLSDQEIVEMIKKNLAKSSPNLDESLQQMNGADASELKSAFPEKWAKKLPTGFQDEAAALDEVGLKKIIVECEGNLYTIDKEKAADVKLTAAKELMKDLSGAYRDAVGAQNAKIKYALFLLEGRGVDLDSTDKP